MRSRLRVVSRDYWSGRPLSPGSYGGELCCGKLSKTSAPGVIGSPIPQDKELGGKW